MPPRVRRHRPGETMSNWKRVVDDIRAVAITEEGDRLTVESLSPEKCWWAVRLWDSGGQGPDREGHERSVQEARRTAEATHRELREKRPNHAPPGKRLR